MDHVDTYLMHHGVKGQQWGNKHGPPYPLDDNPSKQAYKKKKAQQASSDSRKEQKKIAKQERAEYKKKKLPRTSLGLALKNSTMSDAEFREASKKLKRDREVYDGIISDMYRLERAVNLPGMFLNDGVKAIKNIDYIYGLITGSSMTEARRMLARSNSISNRMIGKKNTRIAKNKSGLYYGVGSYLSGDSPRAGGSAAYKNFLDSRLSTKMGDAIPMNMISTSEYDRLMSQFKHSDMSDSNYLQHYGVLGMKWGRRKARPDVNSERREKLNKVKAKVRENLKPWQISGSYKQSTYNHNQSPYQETTKVKASGGININPLSAEKTNEYARKIYELKQRIPRLYHSDLDDNFLCHYGRKGMKWGQHIFGSEEQTNYINRIYNDYNSNKPIDRVMGHLDAFSEKSRKEEDLAKKSGDIEKAKALRASRTLARMEMDPKFASANLSSISNSYKSQGIPLNFITIRSNYGNGRIKDIYATFNGNIIGSKSNGSISYKPNKDGKIDLIIDGDSIASFSDVGYINYKKGFEQDPEKRKALMKNSY